MSEIQVAPKSRDIFHPKWWSDEIRKDAMACYVKGHGSRPTRKLLAITYGDDVPDSRTIRVWFSKYSEEIKDVRGRSRQVEVLEALYDDERETEDVSDDAMRRMLPIVNKGFDEGKFSDLPFLGQLKFVLKENNDRARLANIKIQRTDPALADMPSIMIFASKAKEAMAQKELNGDTPNIIDVAPDEG